jgi:hypothetical protein
MSRLEDGDSEQEREAVIVSSKVRQPSGHIVDHATLHLFVSEVIHFTLPRAATISGTTDDLLDATIAWSMQYLCERICSFDYWACRAVLLLL